MIIDSINYKINKLSLLSEKIKNTLQEKYVQSHDQEYIKSFSKILIEKIKNINDMQIQTKQKIEKFGLGDKSISLNEIMLDIQKSFIALNIGIQINNKIISAYQEIMNMNV